MKELKLALLFGGPSKERGISLNSARSCLDHLRPLPVCLSLFYLHPTGVFYELSSADLYSNTPADFDFKLASWKKGMGEEDLLERLRRVDLVFPLIHGAYGEDGVLQTLLESRQIPFVGSQSLACRRMFHKHEAREHLQKHHFQTLEALFIQDVGASILPFWEKHVDKQAVIKPAMSGSSIGVKVVKSPEEAKQAIRELWEEGFSELLLEPYSEDVEFTVCVLENRSEPVALIPLEIQKEGILDYRKKYLPSSQTRYYCPPRFSDTVISRIRSEAERLFHVFDVLGAARIDGWVDKQGKVRFSDLNPVSGMEQNSFLFQQASRMGLSHTDLLEYLINQTLIRYGKETISRKVRAQEKKKIVHVLMGGNTSERQVSLLSGTNVWLKLLQTTSYEPIAFLLDLQEKIWQLPYDFALHHTVEEMAEHCEKAQALVEKIDPLVKEIRARLHLPSLSRKDLPQAMDIKTFLQRTKQKEAFVFLGLHGGFGEDGTLQRKLQKQKIPFNGSLAASSKLCMDKRETAKKVRSLNDPCILAMPQMRVFLNEPFEGLWQKAVKKLKTEDLLIKPQKDGCSTGVVRLHSEKELLHYLELCRKNERTLPEKSFHHHPDPIALPTDEQKTFLLEPFIETDRVYALQTELCHQKISGWCEMTIGVLERKGKYRSLSPSLTLALHHILSVEEKFQGGTGINITPPPESILSLKARKQVKQGASKVAQVLGIKGYARLDLFVECSTGTIRVIEANTLPALTPSTVLYHQALAESPPISPEQLLVQLIESS